MLRVTWALTAATYGARFQTFCRVHLNLDIGNVVLAETRKEDLNFVEQGILEKCNAIQSPSQPHMIHLRVPDPSVSSNGTEGRKIDFKVGFALVRNGELVYMRVQDHLRKMGLARDAMTFMLRTKMVTGLPENPKQLKTKHETSSDMKSLQRLYRSVQVELNGGTTNGNGGQART
jgi:hypothetical protein